MRACSSSAQNGLTRVTGAGAAATSAAPVAARSAVSTSWKVGRSSGSHRVHRSTKSCKRQWWCRGAQLPVSAGSWRGPELLHTHAPALRLHPVTGVSDSSTDSTSTGSAAGGASPPMFPWWPGPGEPAPRAPPAAAAAWTEDPGTTAQCEGGRKRHVACFDKSVSGASNVLSRTEGPGTTAHNSR